MASNKLTKLKALMRKNIIIMKRNKLSTLFEIIYPLLLLLLLYAIRKSFDKHEYGFQEHELSEEYYRYIISSFIKRK